MPRPFSPSDPSPESERTLLSPSMVGSPRTCPICGGPLRGRQGCCSGRCRAALSRRRREDREGRMRELVKVLAKEAGLTPEDFA